MSMLEYYGLDWVATVLTFAAIYMLGNRNRAGFVVMLVGNVLWVWVGIAAASVAMIVANAGFMLMNVRGYLLWSRSEPQT